MSGRSRGLAFALLAAWFAWAAALQAAMGASPRFADAAPDLGVVLMVSVAGVVARRDVWLVALVAAFARKGFSIDPASAILSGLLALGALAFALRAFVDIHSPPWRAALAALGAGGLALWLELVRAARAAGGRALPELEVAWAPALSTALAALALGGVLAYLPGLSPLRRVGS